MDIIIYNNHLLANNAWSLLESLFHVLNAMKEKYNYVIQRSKILLKTLIINGSTILINCC